MNKIHLGFHRVKSFGRIGVVALLLVGILAIGTEQVSSYEATNGGWSGFTGGTGGPQDSTNTRVNTSKSTTLPSGLVVTVSALGNNFSMNTTNQTLAARGGTSSLYADSSIAASTGIQFWTEDYNCNYGAQVDTMCDGQGTLRVQFSHPVTDPTLSFAGLGGGANWTNNGTLTAQTVTWTELTSTTPGVSLQSVGTTTNLSLTTNNTRIEPTVKNPSSSCTANLGTYATTAYAVCGSVKLQGTSDTFEFSVSLGVHNSVNSCYNNWGNPAGCNGRIEDGWSMVVSVDEDFGDAPTSYDATNGAAHAVGDLTIGASVSSAAAELAESSGSTYNNGANGIVTPLGTNADTLDNAFVSAAPDLNPGSDYTIVVPLSGTNAAGRVCGFLDLNGSGTFTTSSPNESQCANFAQGATSVTLTWPGSSSTATNPGSTWLRLRASYDTTGVNSPLGRLSSGEVEDWQVAVVSAVGTTTTTSVVGATTTTSVVSSPPTTLATSVDIDSGPRGGILVPTFTG